jgi:hypothetical protein
MILPFFNRRACAHLRPFLSLPAQGKRDNDAVAARLDRVERESRAPNNLCFSIPSLRTARVIRAMSGGSAPEPEELGQLAPSAPLHLRVDQRDERLDVALTERLIRGANRVTAHPDRLQARPKLTCTAITGDPGDACGRRLAIDRRGGVSGGSGQASALGGRLVCGLSGSLALHVLSGQTEDHSERPFWPRPEFTYQRLAACFDEMAQHKRNDDRVI